MVVAVAVAVAVGSWNEHCKQRMRPESYKRRRADNLGGIELMRSDDGDVQRRILGDWKIGRLEKERKPGRRERGGCEEENRRSSGREAGLGLSRVESSDRSGYSFWRRELLGLGV